MHVHTAEHHQGMLQYISTQSPSPHSHMIYPHVHCPLLTHERMTICMHASPVQVFINSLVKLGRAEIRVVVGQGTCYMLC
jgi:hypothetical protein